MKVSPDRHRKQCLLPFAAPIVRRFRPISLSALSLGWCGEQRGRNRHQNQSLFPFVWFPWPWSSLVPHVSVVRVNSKAAAANRRVRADAVRWQDEIFSPDSSWRMYYLSQTSLDDHSKQAAHISRLISAASPVNCSEWGLRTRIHARFMFRVLAAPRTIMCNYAIWVRYGARVCARARV